MTKDMFVKSILPIGLLFSGSLILSNTAYLYLSVSYIQMLKVRSLFDPFLTCCLSITHARQAFNPVAILLISWVFRIAEPNRKLTFIVVMISTGVAMASHGELRFDLFGFLTQAAAVAFEASRLVMIQILLHGLKMDPLVSLHYYAPVCAIINLLVLPFTEGLEPFYAIGKVGAGLLFANAGVAFLLNVAAVFLVGVGSGLILTLAGVFKDILLISGSVVIFGNPIAPLQVFGECTSNHFCRCKTDVYSGYSIALGGLVLFKTSGGK